MVGCPCDTSRLGCRTASILSYDCVLLDSLLNWGAIVFTMLENPGFASRNYPVDFLCQF